MTSSLCDLPAREIVRRVRSRECSAVDVLEATLARIRAVEGRSPRTSPYEPDDSDRDKVHAFITLTDGRARAQAEAVDRALAAGEDPGALAGIPLAVKDIFCVRGTLSTAGSRILENFVAPYTATAVERLEAAGEAALSLGTDTAGSIRQPAAFCGVVGLKPTYGRVSRYGLIAFASSLDCPGPIARDVSDAALMLGIIAGADPRDATAAAVPVPDYLENLEAGVRGLRIGLSPDYFRIQVPGPGTGELREQAIAPEIEAAVRRAAGVLEQAGAVVIDDVPMPNTRFGIPAYFVVSRVEAASNLHRYDGVKYGYRYPEPVVDLRQMYRRTRGQGFGPQPKLRILMGMYVSAEQYEKGYYQRALRVRTLIRSDFAKAFDPSGPYRLDALLTATTPTTAFELGAVYGDSVLMQYADLLTVPADHAGVPGLSIPAGLDSTGLPIGVQLLGPDFSEGTLLRIARAYEMATEGEAWRAMRPRVLEIA